MTRYRRDRRPIIGISEDAYYAEMKRANDCQAALAKFMAAYGNCDIPGAIMNLANKPSRTVGGIVAVSEDEACEAAMFAAWVRGAKILGITVNGKRAEGLE